MTRQDEAHALASSHGHTLSLGVRRSDPTAGFNAAETLLASLGACLITNINSLVAKMHLQVDGVRVDIEGLCRDEPPGLVQIRYRLLLDSPEPADKLEKLHCYGPVCLDNKWPDYSELYTASSHLAQPPNNSPINTVGTTALCVCDHVAQLQSPPRPTSCFG